MKSLFPLLLLVPLAACGEFEDSFRNSFREKSVQTCTSEARTQLAASGAVLPDGVSAERICACAVDRLMQGKSSSELMRGDPDPAEQQRAVEHCATQALGGNNGGGKPKG